MISTTTKTIMFASFVAVSMGLLGMVGDAEAHCHPGKVVVKNCPPPPELAGDIVEEFTLQSVSDATKYSTAMDINWIS